jgi:hypothetical protein
VSGGLHPPGAGGDLNAPGAGGDEPGIDPRLRAALDHAPDGELRPPPAVRAAVLAAAHGAQRSAPAPASGWRRWWAAAMAPRALATAASVACVGIALKLAWPEPEWLAAPAAVRQEAAAPALRHDAPAAPAATPQGTAAPTAEAVSDAPPPPAAAVPAPAPVARGLAQDAREKGRELDRRRIEPAPTAAARPPAPIITTTTEPVPPQPAPAQAPVPTTAPVAAPAARAEAAAPEEQRAAKALAADAQALSRSALAEVAPASVAKPAPPGHPSALARWAQALAAPTDDTAQPPAGWQLRRGGEAEAWRPAHRAWWQALLAATAGRWALAPALPAAADAWSDTPRNTWQLRAPDGQAFSLRVEREQLWLQAEGGTWRAPRPGALPDAP